MSGPPELLEVVQRWVQKAENDLITAEHTLQLEERCPYDTVCFHAQQCVERYFKALLTWKWVDFPKTHDVAELFAILPDDARPDIDLAELKELSPYAVEVRYPNDWLQLSREKAVRAVEIARQGALGRAGAAAILIRTGDRGRGVGAEGLADHGFTGRFTL